jgi:arylsulfatase A-like enzyme
MTRDERADPEQREIVATSATCSHTSRGLISGAHESRDSNTLEQHIGTFGGNTITPSLDRLAAEGMEFTRAYYSGVSFIDAQLGRVLEALDRLKPTERTLIVFIGDHGYHLDEREWWNKNTLFERSTRTPLIVAVPGKKPGIARGIVEFVDIYPTIAELCGVKPPGNLAGQSLRPLMDDLSLPGKAAAVTMVARGVYRGDSVRTDRWRYTEWSDGSQELYDHSRDSEETRNVAQSNPEQVKSLSELLHAMMMGQSSAAGKSK